MVLYGCELHAAINSCKVSNRHDAAHTQRQRRGNGDAIWVAASISFGWNCTFLQENAGISFWDGFVTLSNLANGPSISRVKGTGSGGAVGHHTHTPALLHPASRQQPADSKVHETPSSPSLVPFMERITSYLPHCHYKGFLPASGWGGRKRPGHRSMLWCGGGGSGGGGC